MSEQRNRITVKLNSIARNIVDPADVLDSIITKRSTVYVDKLGENLGMILASIEVTH